MTGKAHRPCRTVHGTRKEAESVLREWISDYELDRVATDRRTTLNEFLNEWQKALEADVSELTFERYIYDLDRFVRNTIGRMPLTKIRYSDVQNLYSDLVAKGTGPTSVQTLHAILSKAFNHAVRRRKISVNPAQGCKVPGLRRRVKRRPPKPMNVEQARPFLDASGLTEWAALFELALVTGLRPGEYLGLPWSAIDWERGRVSVFQSAIYPQRGPGAAYIGEPKTKAGRRSIPLESSTLDLLHEHKIEQNGDIVRAGSNWNRDLDLVFPAANGEIWCVQSFRRYAFGDVQEKAGLRGFTPYSLWHTHATLLLLAGENPKIVAERMGHSTVTQTLDTYSHVLPTMQESATKKIYSLLSSRSSITRRRPLHEGQTCEILNGWLGPGERTTRMQPALV